MFVLDSNVCIELFRGKNHAVRRAFATTDPASVKLPSIVDGELLFGAMKSVRNDSLLVVEEFLAKYEIIAFGEREFRWYAKVRTELELQGLRIGANDLVVAATALELGATVVTHNTKEFLRVGGLKVVDWQ